MHFVCVRVTLKKENLHLIIHYMALLGDGARNFPVVFLCLVEVPFAIFWHFGCFSLRRFPHFVTRGPEKIHTRGRLRKRKMKARK